MTSKPSTARQPKGIPAGGQFAATIKSDAGISLPATRQSSPASVLLSAVGTDRDPSSVPWPEDLPNKGYVEVWVSDEDVRNVLESSGMDGDAVDEYDRVYAGICLQTSKEADFWGVRHNGSSGVLALGVSDYEEAVDPFNHADLGYRDGYTDPMPAYLAAREDTLAKRLEVSTGLLQEAGISVELEDRQRQQFRLRTEDGRNLRLQTSDWGQSKLIETTNWKSAEDKHIDDFLGGPGDDDTSSLLVTAATLVARDLHARSYKETP